MPRGAAPYSKPCDQSGSGFSLLGYEFDGHTTSRYQIYFKSREG
jgi:hypothetical protein